MKAGTGARTVAFREWMPRPTAETCKISIRGFAGTIAITQAPVASPPRTLDGLQKHSLIGFNRETPEIRSTRQRILGLQAAIRLRARSQGN
jgi:hypothetical protein